LLLACSAENGEPKMNSSEDLRNQAKMLRNERKSVETCAVLLGFLLWLIFYAAFYISGAYAVWGRKLIVDSFNSDNPTFFLLFLTLPGTGAIFIASIIGAVKTSSKTHSVRPFRIAVADSVDLSLTGNALALWAGFAIHYTFDLLANSIPIFGATISLLLATVPPIVGFPFVLDFVMPRFWTFVFGDRYGWFQGKLYTNLKQDWRKGILQRYFRRFLIGALILVVVLSVILVVAIVAGLLRL